MGTSDDEMWREDSERMARMQAALDAAEKALEPFASMARILDKLPDFRVPRDDVPARDHFAGSHPTIGDLRAAHSAIAQIKQSKGE